MTSSADTHSMTIQEQAAREGTQDVFVARQPIFDSQRSVYAYELLFRGGLENVCLPGDPNHAAGHVLQAAWLTFGLSTLVGQNKVFVNFTRDLLLKGYGETLPVESTVIELLESVDGDPDVIASCERLKAKGYLIALDDFVYRPSLEPLMAMAMADFIKIGFRDSDPEEQAAHVRRVASHELNLLAETVETQDDFDHPSEIGFRDSDPEEQVAIPAYDAMQRDQRLADRMLAMLNGVSTALRDGPAGDGRAGRHRKSEVSRETIEAGTRVLQDLAEPSARSTC